MYVEEYVVMHLIKISKIVIQNKNGSLLLQVLISAGLTTALALAIATLLVQQNKQIRSIEQKAEILDLKNEIVFNLGDENICGCNFNPTL